MQASGSNLPDPPLLQTIKIIMEFVKRFHRDFLLGVTSFEYNQEEFPLPSELKDLITDSVIQLEGSYLIHVYLSILSKPNRTDKLIEAYMNSFARVANNITDLNFIEWTIMCCLVSVVLHDNGFIAAPTIAVETIRGMCVLYERQDAFKMFGCIV